MKLKTLTLSLLLGLAATSAFAEAQYQVRIPANVNLAAPEAPAPEEATSIALRAATLPAGTVGTPYGENQAGFDLSTLLDVTPSSYSLNDISWSVVSGALPAGLEIQADGKLAGTPTVKNEAWASFEVQASYKGADGKQVYAIAITQPASSLGDGISTAGACASGVASSCATWSHDGKPASFTIGEEGLSVQSSANGAIRANLGKTSGKWYWEISLSALNPVAIVAVGTSALSLSNPFTSNPPMWGWYSNPNPGSAMICGGWQGGSAQAKAGDTVGIALDMDSRSVVFYNNGSPVITCSNIASGDPIFPVAGGVFVGKANFGQSDFKYPIPNGYHAGLW